MDYVCFFVQLAVELVDARLGDGQVNQVSARHMIVRYR